MRWRARSPKVRHSVIASVACRMRRSDIYSASGLWGIAVPREFGGADVSYATLAEVTAIISEADPAIGQIPQNHFYMLDVLRVNGTREQQAFYFERALAGERFGNALSERGTKTVADYRTTLTPDGDGFRINGTKFYSTGALFAQWIPIVAKAADNILYVAFASAQTPGLSVVDDWSGFGQRTTGSGTTTLDNIYVEASAVVPYSTAFDARPTTVGPIGQLIHAAVDLGIARAAVADARRFVRERSRPWIDSGVERASDDPLTLELFGKLTLQLHAAEALVERAGRRVDAAVKESTAQTVASGLDCCGRGTCRDHGDRVAGLDAPDRVGRYPGHAGRAQPRPPLAQCTHPYAARSGALEIHRGGQLLPERRVAAASRRALTRWRWTLSALPNWIRLWPDRSVSTRST